MLRTRLAFGLLPLLVLFLVVCLYGIRTTGLLGNSVESVLAHEFHSIRVVQDMRDAAGQMNAARQTFGEYRSRFKSSINDELLHQPSSDKTEMLTTLDDRFQRFTQAGEE